MEKYCPQCKQKYYNSQQRFCLNDGGPLSLPDSYRLVGSTLDGKYQINALVGIGGFGAVYHAHHLSLDRTVAFKILQPNVALQASAAIGLFESEAKTAARLLHENIVTIFDAGRTLDGIAYIAMEWLDGITLGEELEARTVELRAHSGDPATSSGGARHCACQTYGASGSQTEQRHDRQTA